MIFESRPCYHGHFNTDTRPEYEQNLAVLFGISCELSDSTQIPGTTATFTIRPAQPPKNASYSQERVFAATLQTLLLHSRGMSKGHSLTVEIKAEDMPLPEWAAGFARPYFYSDDDLERHSKGEGSLKPLPVPGIRIDETSIPGVTYLIVEGVRNSLPKTLRRPNCRKPRHRKSERKQEVRRNRPRRDFMPLVKPPIASPSGAAQQLLPGD